jgi:ElaB/YqjD/DUF883 family membrane-anchored ribosome-binding protein
MKEFSQFSDATNDAHHDVEAIKEDLKSLMEKLKSLKGNSATMLLGQIDNLTAMLDEVRHKGTANAMKGVESLCNSTRTHPLRNLGYAFAFGAVLTLLLRKD